MTDSFQNGVPFDPGYSKHITSFMDVNSEAEKVLRSIKNPNQKGFRYQMMRGQLISVLMKEIGFYYGCLLWATYIKNQFATEPKEILNNSFYGKTQEELDKYDYLKEVNYALDFFVQYPKDLRYYRNPAKDIEEKYKKVVRIYKEFLILNKSFVNTKTSNDIVLPDAIKTFDKNGLENIKVTIDKTIQDGNFDRLYEIEIFE